PSVRLPALATVPVLYVLTDLIFRYSVALLNFAFQLILTTLDGIQIIVREFAPLFFDLSLDLLPVSFNTVPVHDLAPLSSWLADQHTNCLPRSICAGPPSRGRCNVTFVRNLLARLSGGSEFARVLASWAVRRFAISSA